jgi:uncharacterized iron-regulated membrane protein
VRFLRKSLILIHRYLGIVLSVPFVVWFVSGIAIIYSRQMPTLTPEARIAHLTPLDPGRIRFSPAEAAAKAEMGGPPKQATLLTILGRPAYRFSSGYPVTIFADTGELLVMNAARAAEAARLFTGVPADGLHAVDVLTSADQWTIGQGRSMPLHKFTVDDDDHTELYVSEQTGEVTVLTTRSSRALAWVSAIPHWLYFRAIRTRPQVWRQLVLWMSGLGIISALIGLVLGVIQYRRRPPHIPYTGWLRWHYITGLIFGLFTLTWVFSGFLSMEPWYWASDGGLGPGMEESLAGDSLDLSKFSSALPQTADAREVEYLTIQGDAYYRIQTGAPDTVLVSASSLQVRKELFSTESLIQRLTEPNPNVKVAESSLLQDYDSYYYSFNRKAPLPVLRVKFDDPDSTWFYVDPRMSTIVGRAHRRERLQRWIYHGLHSLDFSFWYYHRPLWDIGVIGLSLGGIALSVIGVVISWKRVGRAVLRKKAR